MAQCTRERLWREEEIRPDSRATSRVGLRQSIGSSSLLGTLAVEVTFGLSTGDLPTTAVGL